MIQLEQCINEYGKDIYAFCSQITRSQQEAEELYQDTFYFPAASSIICTTVSTEFICLLSVMALMY